MLTSEIAGVDSDYVDLQTVFAGNEGFLNTDPETTLLVLPGISSLAGGTTLGDVNQDGVLDFSDIVPFIALLSSDGFLEEADVNQDGVVSFSDIPPFIAILSGR